MSVLQIIILVLASLAGVTVLGLAMLGFLVVVQIIRFARHTKQVDRLREGANADSDSKI